MLKFFSENCIRLGIRSFTSELGFLPTGERAEVLSSQMKVAARNQIPHLLTHYSSMQFWMGEGRTLQGRKCSGSMSP